MSDSDHKRHRRRALLLLASWLTFASAQAVAQPLPIDLDPLGSRERLPESSMSPMPPPPPASAPDNNIDAASLLGGSEALSPAELPMFGEQLFRSGPPASAPGFNPDYVLAVGDRVTVRMWGAFTYEAVQIVDPQGNVFIPNVGPVQVSGVRNADLNDVVRAEVREVYRDNVDVYVSLEAAQPVRVFVTGFVRSPGQYAGASGESILSYLGRAGGIDPERGSYIDVTVLRGGEIRATIDLYDFLLEGRLEPVQLQDGDTIVVGGRHGTVRVAGEVFNTYGFEFRGAAVSASEILDLARPRPTATHVSITHKSGLRQFGEYHALDALDNVTLTAGDELVVVADRTVATILVRVDGAIDSSRVLTLPYGSRLRDALRQIQPTAEAQPEAVQLYRASVAQRQREMLDLSLRVLETNALTARSTTSEEAALRGREAEQIVRFIERARAVQPRGQVVLAGRESAMETLLQDGDVIVIPERSSIVMVHGEVTQPSAIAYESGANVRDYVALAGGTTQRRRNTRMLLVRRDGTFVEDARAEPQPGDEILVLPKVSVRNVEVARGITQILYQLAIAAKVVLDL